MYKRNVTKREVNRAGRGFARNESIREVFGNYEAERRSFKKIAQAEYYRQRLAGMDHAEALAYVIDRILDEC